MSNESPDQSVQLEARIYEQEHRLPWVAWNWVHRKQWGKDDPRRRAVWRALIWTLLPAGGKTVVGVGLLATLPFTVWSIVLHDRQNHLIETEGKREDGRQATQNALIEA